MQSVGRRETTMDWMKEAYRRTRKDGAVGGDGQTARQYEQRLEENLQGLLNRAKAGTYRAPPVRALPHAVQQQIQDGVNPGGQIHHGARP